MSLNDKQLSPELIARLYSNSLISQPNLESVQIIKPEIIPTFQNKKGESLAEKGWKSLGSNRQNILIVVCYPDKVHLPDDELSFLTNMLAACNLSLADVIIINQNNYKECGYKEILVHYKSRIVLLFDVKPTAFGLPVSFPQFQVQNVAGCTFLCAPSLEENIADKLFRTKLWFSLRTLFGI